MSGTPAPTSSPVGLSSFGREVPQGLALLPGTGDLSLLVVYRDGLERFTGSLGKVVSSARCDLPVEVARVVSTAAGAFIVAGGSELTVLSFDLQAVSSTPAPEDEPLRGIVPLAAGRFLTFSDDETVRAWTIDQDGTVQIVGTWPVHCTPLFARPNGKSVFCVENGGRLSERDAATGTILKGWSKTAPIVSAFGDSGGHTMVTIDEDGLAAMWDLHSRELLFAFSAPLKLHHGVFSASGVHGVLLSQDGDLLVFSAAQGGTVSPTAPMPPATDIVYGPAGELLALDENGGLWHVTDAPVALGGTWAGWATGGLALSDGRTVVGTASGELLLFEASGEAAGQISAHGDAVVGLFEVAEAVLSVAADGSLARVGLAGFGSSAAQPLGDYSGEAVVSLHMETGGGRLWLGLEEGKVAWLDPQTGHSEGEYQFPDHRIEELRPGGRPGEILVLTDRGSLKKLSAS